ncbi:MAG: hypothetical protein AB7G75_27440 [Candidatus Binatia bacterium]
MSKYSANADIEIYRGLLSGYIAKLAVFVGEEKLDKIRERNGYCGRFSWSSGEFHYRDILPIGWQ